MEAAEHEDGGENESRGHLSHRLLMSFQSGGGPGSCGAQKLDRDKTADESHLLLQIIVSQIPAITIRVEPMVEMDLVEIRGNDLLAQFMRLRAHKRHVPAS